MNGIRFDFNEVALFVESVLDLARPALVKGSTKPPP
jgi:hypothetical protein